jgi:hypothetical protein
MIPTARVQRGPSDSLHLSWREWPRLPFTARIERALSECARSASKKGTWPLPLILLRPRVARARGSSHSPHPLFNSLLQFLQDPFYITGQFHVALPMNRLSLCRAGCLDGAFPIGDLGAAFGGKFLIGHAGYEFE